MKKVLLLVYIALFIFIFPSSTYAANSNEGNVYPTVTPTKPLVTCTLVEVGPRYSGNVVSSTNTQINPLQNLALVASIANDDGNHTSIQWETTGGRIHNSSWDLTEWQAPETTGTYVISLSIYHISQPTCTITFTVVPQGTTITPLTPTIDTPNVEKPSIRLNAQPLISPRPTNVTCKLVEIGPRYSRNIVSSTTTNVSAAQNFALVASILNDDGNHTSIIWNTTGGFIHNTSWDLTEWRAPTTPGTYHVTLSIYNNPQQNCTSTFVVGPNTSAVTCKMLESYSRYSGNTISQSTTIVRPRQRIPVVASIANDDGNHTSITWQTSGGKIENYHWDIIDWVAPATPGMYSLGMNIYGAKQRSCQANFLVTQPSSVDQTSQNTKEIIQNTVTQEREGTVIPQPFAQVEVTNLQTKQTFKTQADINGTYTVAVEKNTPKDTLTIKTTPTDNILTRLIQFFIVRKNSQEATITAPEITPIQ